MEEIITEINKCIDVLKQGGTILYPTDTVWGIGCDATNEEAVAKVYKLKKREDSKSMIILLDNEAKLLAYIREVPEQAYDLMDYSEKPITIIYPDAKNLAPNVIADDRSIAIRITKDDFCRRLIEKFRKPIISTSANISGDSAPASFSMINKEIIEGVDYIVNLRQNENHQVSPSTIIKLGLRGEFKIIRK
jgi:L-threonylcarbamoyladenylate synthase